MVRLATAKSDRDYQVARVLFEEYADWLGIDLCFQNFDRELEQLSHHYGPPGGCLLLAEEPTGVAGCIALRRLDDETCEMKRLYVRPPFRGMKLGRTLTEALIDEARKMGYKRMRLDTLPPKMKEAVSLYYSLGFKQIEPYYDNPTEGTLYLELSLAER